MKKKLLLALICLISIPGISQQITGIVRYFNRHGKTAENIRISAFGCTTTHSLKDGVFILDCPRKSYDQKIKLIIGNTDNDGKAIELVNFTELEKLKIQRASDIDPVEVIICYAGQREDAALHYYDIITKKPAKEFEKRLDKLNDQLAKNIMSANERKVLISQIEELKTERDAALGQLERQAQYAASINLDKASEEVKNAVRNIELEKEIEKALTTINTYRIGQEALPNPLNTIRGKIAEIFDKPIDLIELNFPPADGRYPGSILVTPQKGQTLLIKRETQPQAGPKSASNISISLDGSSNSKLVSKLLGQKHAYDDLNIQIDLRNLKVHEIELSKRLKKELLKDGSIHRAEKNGLKPRAIVRAYEAMATYTIKKKDTYIGNEWNTIKKNALKIGAKLTTEGGLSIKNDLPSIIAFESVNVNFITSQLTGGEPDDVLFEQYLVEQQLFEDLNLESYGLSPGKSNVYYYGIGNVEYASKQFGNLTGITRSIGLFSKVMDYSGAIPLMDQEPFKVVTTKLLDKQLKFISEQLGNKKAKSLFVFYYYGHAVVGQNGQQYLVLKNYKGDPLKDIGDQFLFGINRVALDDPQNPLGGSNLGDLIDATAQIRQNDSGLIDGLYPVSEIANKLDDLGVPYILLIDACYNANEMEELRENLSLTTIGDYYGPKDFGGAESVHRYVEEQRKFGNSPFLNTTNVVIMSAAPGSIAIETNDPESGLLENNKVAPLAKRLNSRFESALINGEPVTYGRFLYPIIDVKDLGEVKIYGTASWSDFSVINKIEMFRKKK